MCWSKWNFKAYCQYTINVIVIIVVVLVVVVFASVVVLKEESGRVCCYIIWSSPCRMGLNILLGCNIYVSYN